METGDPTLAVSRIVLVVVSMNTTSPAPSLKKTCPPSCDMLIVGAAVEDKPELN